MLVTTAGGVEEDLIKCLAPTYIGDFSLRGQDLRQSGINRYGAPGSPPGHRDPLPGLDCPPPQDWEPAGAQRQLLQIRRLADAHPGADGGRAGNTGGGWPARTPGSSLAWGGRKGPSRLGPPWLGVLSVVVWQGVRWTPSRMIARLGKEINNPESVCYWAQKVGGDGGGVVTAGVTAHHRVPFPEQHPGAEPGAHRWLPGGHDLLPLLQAPRAGAGHCGR